MMEFNFLICYYCLLFLILQFIKFLDTVLGVFLHFKIFVNGIPQLNGATC
jgi:hypothetical protein